MRFTRRLVALILLAGMMPLFAASGPDWVEQIGGRIDRDAAGEVIGLHLRGTWVTDTELVDVSRLPKLERLDLSHTRITDEGLLHLKPAKQIKDLNLFYTEQITDQGMSAIREWGNLRRLNVRGTRVTDGTMAIVSGLSRLESLDIAYTQIDDDGLDSLATLTQLKQLSIGRSNLGKAGSETLRLQTTLEYLDLGGPHPGPDGYRERTAGTPMSEDLPRAIATLKRLRVLKLSYSQIGPEGLRILSSLDRVEKLALEGSPHVNDQALVELARWKGLKYLDLQATGVTPRGVAVLKKARPGIVILSGPFPASKLHAALQGSSRLRRSAARSR